jgi:hypothetical protein
MKDRAVSILVILTLVGHLLLALVPLALADNGEGEVKATFSVVSLPGDCNGDGLTNALDITCVERIILELDPETPAADANRDGRIDTLDIAQVELIIMRR